MLSSRILRAAFRGVSKMQYIWVQPPLNRAALHNTVGMYAKLFIDKENKYAHTILQQSLKPYQIFRLEAEADSAPPTTETSELPPFVLKPPTNSVEALSGDEIFKHFCTVICYCMHTKTPLSDERFNAFSQVFCETTHKLSDAQLLETLRQIACLTEEETVRAPNFKEIWNMLDGECCRRLDTWDVDQKLLVCDAWYSLNLARISEFVWEALRKLGRKVARMRPEQLVHAMFFCNVIRKPIYEMIEFEINLMRCVDQMSLQELGVMSMGFFKTQTPIRNPELIEHLYRRLMAELDTVEDITLVAIIKVLRYSSKIAQVEVMTQLLNSLCAQVDRLSLLSCLHVALLGSDLQYCHDEIIERILQRFNREIEQTRLKDLERICLVIGLFNYQSPSRVEDVLCVKILAALRTKIDEIIRHPRCFPTCLHFLTLKGYYDPEMISSVLDKQFIRRAYGSNMTLGREIFYLDSFVKINLKDNVEYTCNQLPDKLRRTMGKLLTHYIPERNPKYKLNKTDRVLMEIKETTDYICRCNTFKHILPHFERPDVIICYDRNLRDAVPLSAECPGDYTGEILTRKALLGDRESEDIDTVAIVVAGWNNVLRGKNTYTGLFEMKLKQLRLLGHKDIVIPWHEWHELETQTDRQKFLKRKLAKIIHL